MDSRFKGRCAGARQGQSLVHNQDDKDYLDMTQYMEFDQLLEVTEQLDSIRDESVLTLFFRQLAVNYKLEKYCNATLDQTLADCVISLLERRQSSDLLNALLSFVNAVFSRVPTPSFGVVIIEDGLCASLVELFTPDDKKRAPQILKILAKIAGGSLQERNAVASVLPLDSLLLLARTSCNSKLHTQACLLLRNFCCHDVSPDQNAFFCAIRELKDLVSVDGKELLLWSIYHLRQWDKEQWARTIDQMDLLGFVMSSCSPHEYKLAKAALTVLIRYRKDGAAADLDPQVLMEMLKSPDSRYPTLVFWAAEQFVLLKSEYCVCLRDAGFVEYLLSFMNEGVFEEKEELMFCFSRIVACDPSAFFEVILRCDVLHSFAEHLESSGSVEFTCATIDMLESVLSVSKPVLEVYLRFLESVKRDFVEFLEECAESENDKLAYRACMFLSQYIDAEIEE